MSEQLQSERRRPPPRRGRPGSKRQRTVINLDDITTVAPPEEAAENISPLNSNQSEKNNDNESASNKSIPTETNEIPSFEGKESQKTATVSDPMPDSGSDSEEEQEDKGQWWTLAEKQHMLSGWVMDKLDKMITKAERKEERSLMNYFDEQILMQQLLHNIPKASKSDDNEDDSNNESEEGAGMEVESESGRLVGENSSHKSSSGALRTAAAINHGENDDSDQTNMPASIELPTTSDTPVHVETNEQPSPTIIRRALPKWIPKSSETDTTTERLFTPQEFDTCVIQTVVNKLPQGTCQIHLIDAFLGDSDSYLLEARIFGNENAESTFGQLQKTTEAFVRSRISGVNLRWLLEDGASLELELSLNINEPLGMRFSNFRLKDRSGTRDAAQHTQESPPGLWINRVLANEGLAKALGSHTAFDHGCALLSMGGTIIQDPLVLRKVLQSLKKNFTLEKPGSVSFKICISRHADLRAIPLSKLFDVHNLKRRDGQPIHVDSYPGLADDIESNIPKAASTRKGNGHETQSTSIHSKATAVPKANEKKNSTSSKPEKIVENDDRPSPKASKKQRESDVSSEVAASNPNIVEKEDRPSPKVSKKQRESTISSKPASTTVEKEDRPSPKASKKQKEIKIPSKTAAIANDVAKEDHSSPKISEKLVHPSFPQHLLVHPSFPQHLQTSDESNADEEDDKSSTVHASRSPQPSKKIVHSSFQHHFETLVTSKTAEKRDEKSSDNHIQSPQASKEIVHPSFLHLFHTLTESKAAEEDGEKNTSNHFESPQGWKKVLRPSSPKNVEESKESGVRNKSTDKAASKPNDTTATLSTPDKGSSDMSMSSASDGSSSPRITFNTKPGNKASNASAKDSQVLKPDSDNGHPSKTSNENTDAFCSTSEMNGGMELDEDKPVQRPVSNTLLADSVNTRIENGTSATDNGPPPKKSEKTVGKESVPKPISDGGKDKNNEERSQNRAASKNSTAARTENDNRANTTRRRSLSHDATQSSRQKVINSCPTSPSNKRRRSISGGMNDFSVSPSHKRQSTICRYDPYEVALDTRRPLGGFFRNERGQNYYSKCVISSICPGGQLSVDARIKIGTQVTATMVGERRVNVEDYTHIKNRYNDAKYHRKNIRLILQNNHSCKNDPIHLSRNYWSSSGSWLGSMSSGWSGGASIKISSNGHGSRSGRETEAHAGMSSFRLPLHERLEQERKRRLQAERNDMDMPDARQNGHGSTSDRDTAEGAGRLSRWERLEQDRQRLQQDEELEEKKKLSEKKQREGSSIGSFSRTNDSQETSSCERPMSPNMGSFSPIATIDGMERPPNSPLFSGERSVADAIRNKSWKDLLSALERGPDFTEGFVQHVLKNQYSYLDAELKKANSSSPGTGTGGFQLALWERLEQERKKRLEKERQAELEEDLEAKKKILKLYINSVYLIQKADSLRNWADVTIQIKNLHIFRLPSRTDTRRSEVISATARKMNSDVDLCNLPTTRIGHRVSYSTSNEFSVYNNYRASLENRKIVVAISEGDPKVDKIHCNKLGQFVLRMNEIESKCPPDGSWHTMEHKLEGIGTIGFIAKRKRASKQCVVNKRREILDMLKTQLETIERFNGQYCSNPSASVKLTPNIRGLHGTSLLYASIGVNADEQLIQKMVSLGADPRKRHNDRSPLDLARDQYERCKNKEKDASESSNQQVRQACAQKSSEAKRLLNILEGAR